MKPVVDGLEQEYSDRIAFMVYGDVNSDVTGGQFAQSKGVSAVPTMVLVSASGTELERWVGAVPAEQITSAFDEAVAGR